MFCGKILYVEAEKFRLKKAYLTRNILFFICVFIIVIFFGIIISLLRTINDLISPQRNHFTTFFC